MALADFFFFLFFLLYLPFHHALLNPEETSFQSSLIRQACFNTTKHKDCTSYIHTECHIDDRRATPVSIMHAAVKGTINEAIRAIESVSSLVSLSINLREKTAIDDCVELLDYSVSELGWSLEEMSFIETEENNIHREGNLRAWLSAALSNQDTCLEGFHGTDGRLKNYIRGSLDEVTQLISNVLEMYRRLRSIMPHFPVRNETIGGGGDHNNYEIPPWITSEEEELMHGDPKGGMRVDAVVAGDGSGRYRTIMAAVNEAPSHSSRRYIIYVKKGIYRENVELKKKKSNIMLVGDGIGATVITGSRNFMQGWTTFRTATFAVSGQGFIARDITFRNTAGPANHQAVALRVDSDRSAFYRCSIEGYQDTLYAHSLRQFYRECNIYGTIDFIFGNGHAVLQNCKIFSRRPLPFQKVTITAQGRKDPNQNTGFSIHNSYVYATYPTYLGRPWKAYSRTVFMQTYLSAQVQPQGWLEWFGDFGLRTLFYGEYMNYGPGSSVAGRVRWPGYHVIKDEAVASYFTVRRFIDGTSWLPSTGVAFTADLIK
ncbi:putative pectinesterase/pectinesterase inhibitor 22 [Dioscorea cayenensis subsp. rotundata]|uniref:Pectinesterase n=1 Tax=Dioscorea cayennensis subsp. rotundata TaxID=55577 RepID=A0AB40BQ10_DIOCR|nr:putative pectinesterase/pectinesterase inhibitor 22 [Dioscorea cayenensis subsp. rotundata]